MKKNLNALMLLGIALTLGTGSVVRARDIGREARSPEGLSFKSNRQIRLQRKERARVAKQDYAAEAVRERQDGSLAEYRQGYDAREFISDFRLRDYGRADYIRAYEATEERSRDVNYREDFAHRDHWPDKAWGWHKDGKHPGHVRDASSWPERTT